MGFAIARVVIAVTLTAAAESAASQPPTLISTNLCADLLVLELAAPEQILSLSRQTRALEQTPLAEQARRYPTHRGSIEELLALHPDLVLAYSGWSGRRHAKLLARQGIDILEVPYPSGWDDALTTARRIGAAIGRASQANRVAAAADARMQELAAALPRRRVLYLRPNGGSAGAGTYVDELITSIGLRNVASEQGMRGWGEVPLEQLVMTPPDLFLLGYFSGQQALDGSGVARHPLLRDLLRRTPSISLPANGWGCGGLELLRAAELIAADLGTNQEPTAEKLRHQSP